MPTVLLLTNHLRAGGIAAYSLLLAEHLPKAGIRTVLAAGDGEWRRRISREVSAYVPCPLDTAAELNPGVWRSFLILDRFIKQHPVQVIHAQTRVTQVLGAALAHRHHIPLVTTCHGAFKRRFVRRLFPLWGERVIAISKSVEIHLIQDWHVPPSRIRRVLHGLESVKVLNRDARTRRESCQAMCLSQQVRWIGAIGRFSHVKGFDLLLTAFARVKDALPDWGICLVGTGDEGPQLRSMTVELGITDRVVFCPTLSERQYLFGAIELLCAPSREEGFGLSILEAMAHALPVIATRVGGIPDLVDDEASGLLVPPDQPSALSEAILRLAKDESLRMGMGSHGREITQTRFTLRRMIDETSHVYRECLSPAGGDIGA